MGDIFILRYFGCGVDIIADGKNYDNNPWRKKTNFGTLAPQIGYIITAKPNQIIEKSVQIVRSISNS